MKILLLFGVLIISALTRSNSQVVSGEIVKDPLLAYLQSNEESAALAPENKVYLFRANFAGDGRKFVFITSESASLGSHGDYGWTVYCPLRAGGYLLLDGIIFAGISGPEYIGYIDQIKRCGIVVGGKEGVLAQYLAKGELQSQQIDNGRGHADPEHYPKDFGGGKRDYHISSYTFNQLKRKYRHPDPANVLAPATR
jgi:hypothetical protein